jgi:hypothetical protein
MGAVAQAVGDFVSQAAETVFEPIKQIGQIAESAVREVGHAVESVGREIGKVGQAAINDPVGTIAKVAAIATQQYWALPLISAADVVAHGGNLGQAALAAGVSYAGGAIAAGVGDYLSSAGSAGDVAMAAEDAKNLVSQGYSSSQISDVLKQSYNFSPEVANNITAQSILGNSVTEIAKDVGGQMATQNMLAAAAGNTVGGAARAALSGGDASQILLGGVTSGAGSLVGSATSSELKDLGINNTVANVLGKATGAATASTIAGRDAKLSFINSLINTTLSESGKQVSSELKAAWNSTNDAASKFNSELTQAQTDYNTKLTPLEQDAKTAQETAASSYDAYKAVKDKFDGIVADYNAAKAAGDVEKANSLADQANALLPQLNDATTKYNGDVATFDTKLATYNTAADQYKTQTDAIAAAKTEYDARNADLQATTKAFTETALKVADMGDNAKTAFEKLYNDGNSLTTSFDTVKSLDGLGTVAQDTFLRQYDQSKDPTASLTFAQKIDSLAAPDQTAYSTAVKTGLDDTSALQIAPQISGMNTQGQNAYLESLKRGDNEQTAVITATLADLFGQQNTTPTSTPVDSTAVAATNTTGSVTDAGAGATTPLPKGTVTVSAPTEPIDPNAPGIPIPPEQATTTEAAPTEAAPADGGTYIQPTDPNVDNRDVGNGESSNPNAVAPQVPGETLGATTSGTGSVTDTLNKATSGINIPTTGTSTTTVKAPVVSAPVAAAPATPWTLPTFTAPAVAATAPLTTTTPTTTSTLPQQNVNSGIQNLTPGLTQRMDYNLTGIPNIQETSSPEPNFATGGSTSYDPFAAGSSGDSVSSGLYKSLTPGLTKAQINYILTGLPGANIQSHAEGGEIGPEEHNPTFFSEGGLNSMENRYVQGEGDGTSDSVAAMLANGEFVIPADVVSKLGNGSNEAGASVLDQFLKVVRKDANSNGEELPPKSKGPLAYLLDAKRTMKA